MKNIRFTGLAVVAVLVIYAAWTVFSAGGRKETPYERSIRRLESRITRLADGTPEMKEATEELAELRDMRVDPEEAEAKIAELEKTLASLPKDADEKRADLEREIRTYRMQIPSLAEELPVNLGLDLLGGTEVRLRIRSTRQEREVAELRAKLDELDEGTDAYKQAQREYSDAKARLQSDIDTAVDIIRSRLNRQGLSEIPVTKEGSDRIRVQLPGMDSDTAKTVIETIRTSGKLEFRLVIDEDVDAEALEQVRRMNLPPDTYNISLEHNRALEESEITSDMTLYDWLRIPAEKGPTGEISKAAEDILVKQERNPLTGKHITIARPGPNPSNPLNYQIEFRMDLSGAARFATLTRANVGRRLAIILDGKAKSAPVIRNEIPDGSGVITGGFTAEQARRLTVILKEGSLPVDIEVEMENTVGPTLGEASIRRGLEAVVAGVILVLVFMALYYLVAGAVTDVCMIINLLFIVAMLSAMGAVLTLPGIAGLILTVGMAVDANVLIFERIREEKAKGAALPRAVANGYERAFSTIIDANITTFITTLILYQFGTEAVRGFAVTLMFGIICSVFVSLYVTRTFFDFLLDARLVTDLKMLQLVRAPSVDFIGKRRVAMTASAVVILAGLVVFVSRGRDNLAHDLSGGVFAHINTAEKLSPADAQAKASELRDMGFEDATVQSFGAGDTEWILRTRLTDEASAGDASHTVSRRFQDAIREVFPLASDGVETEYVETRDDGSALWEVTLGLREPLSPAEAEGVLRAGALRTVDVRPAGTPRPSGVETATGEIASATITFETHDRDGKLRSVVVGAGDAAQTIPVSPPTAHYFVEQALADAEQDLFDPETITVEQLRADNLDPEAMPREVTLTAEIPLARAATKTEVENILAGISLFKNVSVAMHSGDGATPDAAQTESSRSLVVLCETPRIDASGNILSSKASQERYIRNELSALRGRGIEFSEPFSRFNIIGPRVAQEMARSAVMALVYAMIAIFFYIWLRFQFRAAFGAGACLALVHDVLFTLGAVAVADELGLNIKIDLTIVAALLTIVGYSLNDTIVVFDRIRENLKSGGRDLKEIINVSVNQTLSRTLLTSVTTLLVVTALLVWGGEVIRGFAFSLFVGVLVGTYSSIFIAAPCLVELDAAARKRSADASNTAAQPKDTTG